MWKETTLKRPYLLILIRIRLMAIIRLLTHQRWDLTHVSTDNLAAPSGKQNGAAKEEQARLKAKMK